MDKFSFVGNSEIEAIDELYQRYRSNPESVDESWRSFFKGFELARTTYGDQPSGEFDKEFKVLNLIDSYRKRGHLFTQTNPVRKRRTYSPTLDIDNFGLSNEDLDIVFEAGKTIGIGSASLRQIVSHLEQTYCASVGVEYTYIRKPDVVEWLRYKMESTQNLTKYTPEERKHVYWHLVHAVGFEQFIHKKFVGQKRFSLEGAEALVPALDAVIEHGAELGIQEFVIGMPHRGRLNILNNILRKPPEKLFAEFMGERYDENIALGDVKYHLGYDNKITTDKGKEVFLSMLPNPSHLEMVGPVAEGIARARIDHRYGKDFKKVAPIIIHGDAAIAGQGVVYETIQMSHLKGYTTGGTIHLVINNQVGFTTNYLDARSSTYCTDVAKVTQSPVFHVNGDHPEALIHTIKLAVEYRQTFHTDVFIDILCYRKYGHNEGDEPRFTQPTLYDAIAKHLNPRDIYANFLMQQGIMNADEAKLIQKEYDDDLDAKLELAKTFKKVTIKHFLEEDWKGFRHSVATDFNTSPITGVPLKTLHALFNKINTLPDGKPFFKKLAKLLDDRKQMVESNKLDWAIGELLAYASIAAEGHPVRLSGQDCERGTFSHRHAAFNVENSDEKYFPLQHIADNQAPVHVYNSHLSEYGVMGFEYGYALGSPNGLTIWEAQFGDFYNVAQPIIDQYISSAEDKWGLLNGLTLLLPHGYEGQGPEHSSARIERFLTLCAHNNMQVVNPTTPANMFHLLRRQVMREFTLPLVVLTPKSLLRHPKCVSTMQDLSSGAFQEVIDDPNTDPKSVLRVVLCSGKIYYDLLARKEQLEARDIAIIRIEQLYPFPKEQVLNALANYPNAIQYLWVQEEPENMGAWNFVNSQLPRLEIKPVTRQASGSPAVGLSKLHFLEQEEIIGKVFRKCDCELKNKYCGLQCKVGSARKNVKVERDVIFEEE